MEQWQNIICIYFGIEILLCICTLVKYSKLQKTCKKSKDFSPLKKVFFQFILLFLLILAALVLHISYLIGSISSSWPILVVLGLMITSILTIRTTKKK